MKIDDVLAAVKNLKDVYVTYATQMPEYDNDRATAAIWHEIDQFLKDVTVMHTLNPASIPISTKTMTCPRCKGKGSISAS